MPPDLAKMARMGNRGETGPKIGHSYYYLEEVLGIGRLSSCVQVNSTEGLVV
jgi:hypothetical protein